MSVLPNLLGRKAVARAAYSTTKAIIEALEKRQYFSSIVYQNDFQGSVGSEWSKTRTDTTPSGRKFLGQFGGGSNGWLNGGSTWVSGHGGSGSAVQLNGSTGYISIEQDDSLPVTGAVTVNAWVKFSSTSGTPVIVEDVPTAGGSGFLLGLDSGKLYFEIHNSSNTIFSNKTAAGGTTLSTNTWYQVTGTFANGKVSTYINGNLDRQGSPGGTLTSGGTTVIGRRKGVSNRFLNGVVDDVQIYNRALDRSDLALLPNGVTNGLKAYWNLDENTGTRIHDTAGAAGVTLSLTNLPIHSQLTLTFDLYVIHSWDGRSVGNAGPDIWTLTADGSTLINTTFANGNSAGQSYPGSYPTANNPKQTGASEIDKLGYGSPSDSVYHIIKPITHSADSAIFNFSASDLQDLTDESWGLDNVSVSVDSADPSIKGATTEVNEGSSYALNLFPGDKSITGWTINWGDGSETISGNPSSRAHTYTDGDVQHTISATATDGTTTYTTNSVAVSVLNVAPTLTLSGSPLVRAGSSYNLGLTSTDPGADTITSWFINWGDGQSQTVTGNPSSASHTYSAAGNYIISGKATDEDGTWDATSLAVSVLSDPGSSAVLLSASGVGDHRADLVWTAPSDPSATFEIQGKIGTGSYSALGTAAAGSTSLHLMGLSSSTNYTFRVRVISGGSTLGYSNEVAATTLADGTIYSTDFEKPVAGEWSSTNRSVTPLGARTFLGEFNNSGSTLALSGLPTHSGLTISFDLYVIRSWDGSDTLKYGPDRWIMDVDGANLIDTTFSNHDPASTGTHNDQQTYPNASSSGVAHSAFFGSQEHDSLGYTWKRMGFPGPVLMDAVYHITQPITHTGSSITIHFSDLLTQSLQDESWGLDNIKIVATSQSATDLTATATPSHTINLKWAADGTGLDSFTIERSTDGTSFSVLASGVAATARTYEDTTVTASQQYWYRVHGVTGGTSASNSNVANATVAPTRSAYLQIETIAVPMTGVTVNSATALQSGVNYQLRASGSILEGDYTDPHSDAEYANFTQPQDGGLLNNVDIGISVNDAIVDANKYPYWGPYNSGHQYTVNVVGSGTALTLSYHDDSASDNQADPSGTPLSVDLWQLAPAPATTLAASADDAQNRIDLSWTDNADYETGFRIERSTDGTNFTFLKTVGASEGTGQTVNAFDDTAVVGTTYTYRVFALLADQYATTEPSNTASAIRSTSNSAPSLVPPTDSFQIPAHSHPPKGPIEVVGQSSQVIALDQTNQDTEKQIKLSIPKTTPQKLPVDIFLLMDDTGSFANTGPALAAKFPTLLRNLKLAYPDVDFGVGVGRMEEYAKLVPTGPDSAVASGESPFILNQPIVQLGESDFTQPNLTSSNSSQVETAILDALTRAHPERAGYSHSSTIEALYQIATGAGLDMGDDGLTTSSGNAGSATAQTHSVENPWPRLSDIDVPAFSSFAVDPSLPELPPAGTIGGVGFRKGAIPIVLVATDSPLVYKAAANEQPTDTIVGHPDGRTAEVPLADFKRGIDTTFTDGSGTHHVVFTAQTLKEASVHDLGHTIQDTVNAIDAAGIRVVGLGSTQNPVDPNLPPDQDPRAMLEALAKLSGAINQSGAPIDNTQEKIAPGNPLFFPVNNNDGSSIATGIESAIGAVLADSATSVDTSIAGSGVILSSAPTTIKGLANGESTTINVTLQASSTSASSDLLMVDSSKGWLLGSVPIRAQASYREHLVTNDADGDAVSIRLLSAIGPNGSVVDDASVDSGNYFSFTPTDAGTYTFQVELSDAGHKVLAPAFNVTVSEASSTNHDPVLASISSQTAVVGKPFSATASASDADGQTPQYFLFNAPQGMTIDSASGEINWTPLRQQLGKYTVTVLAIDGTGGQAEQSFDLTVSLREGGNHAPIFVSGAPDLAVVGRTLSYQLEAVDPDQDTVTYEVGTNPDNSPATLLTGMHLSPNGALTWTPTADQVGDYTFHFLARDAQGATTPYDLEVHVRTAPPTPTNLSVSDFSDSQMVLWDEPSSDASLKYNVYAYKDLSAGLVTDRSPIMKLTPLPVSERQFDVTFLHNVFPRHWYFGVAAVNSDGIESDVSGFVFGGPPAIRSVLVSRPDPRHIALSVGEVTDEGGNVGFNYIWQVTDTPDGVDPSQVVIGTNNSPDAHDIVVEVPAAGNYQFQVKLHPYAIDVDQIDDMYSPAQTVNVHVEAEASRIEVSNGLVSLTGSGTQSVLATATVYDQFNHVKAGDSINWTVANSPHLGSIDSTGLYSANGIGVDVVQATDGSAIGYALVAVNQSVTNLRQAIGTTVSAKEGVGLNNRVFAAFVDETLSIDAAHYSGSIDWGDGLQSPWTAGATSGDAYVISVGNGVYYVLGTHTYRSENNLEPYTASVTITSSAGTALTATTQVNVSDAAVQLRREPLSITSGTAFTGKLATILDANPFGDPSEFTADVDWGDSTSHSTITASSSASDPTIGLWGDGHVYSVAGNYLITITEEEDGDSGRTHTLQVPVTVGVGSVARPTGVSASAVSSDVIELSWTAVPGAGGYIIERTNPDGTVTTLPGTNLITTSNPYFDTGSSSLRLQPNSSYHYRIFAQNTAGQISAASDEASATTYREYVPPNVTDVTAEHTVAEDESGDLKAGILLTWIPRSEPNVTGYDIERQNPSTGAWSSILPSGDVIDATSILTNGRLTRLDTSVDFSSVLSYRYRIVSIDVSNRRSGGAEVVAVKDIIPPSLPKNVRASSYRSAIQLTWDDRPSADDEDFAGWNVYRLSGTTWIKLNSSPITDETGYNDFNAPQGVVDQYRVTSVDLLGNESDPVEVSKKRSTNGEPSSPELVSVFLGTRTADHTPTLDLNWSAVTVSTDPPNTANDALAGYRVYRSTDPNFTPSSSSLITPTLLTSAAFTDGTTATDELADSTTYYYAVTAVDLDGDESAPTFASRQTGNNHPPAQPGAISFSNVAEAGMTVTWSAGTTGSGNDPTTGFVLYRSETSGGPFIEVANLSASTTGFDDSGLSPSTTYYYRVYSVDADGELSSATSASHATITVQGQSPFVQITSPNQSTSEPLVIGSDTAVRGIVDDFNNDLKKWALVLRPTGAAVAASDATDPWGPNDIIVSQGTTERGSSLLNDVVLGTIKPSLLADGLYKLVLVANDNAGNPISQSVAPQPIQIKSQVKLGNLTLPFVDLQLDVPGGQPITVTRVYDSQQANVDGDFGYGWRLELSDSAYHTTARTSDRDPAKTTLRAGDVVYLTLPGGDQHAFQFLPRPIGYNPGLAPDPLSPLYVGYEYAPVFVSVDGSGAILTVPNSTQSTLRRDGVEFFMEDFGGIPYDPAVNLNGGSGVGTYQVKTTDGTVYTINASTGEPESSIDANQNVTNYASLTGVGGLHLQVNRNSDGHVTSIAVMDGSTPVGNPIVYGYLDSDNQPTDDLLSVEGRDLKTTKFAYDPNRPHYLNSITDPRGISVLAADYNKNNGQLQAITDASGDSAPVRTAGFNGTTASQTVTDLSGNDTENVYDSRGNVTREIRAIRDPSGNITQYQVTVHTYDYASNTLDTAQMGEFGISNVNALHIVTDYQPFTVVGADSADRYTQTGTQITRQVEYGVYGSYNSTGLDPYNPHIVDPNFGQIVSETVYDQGGAARKTDYLYYKLGKPQKTIDHATGAISYSKYDDGGNLLWTVNALGEGTKYVYTTTGATDLYHEHSALPAGLQLKSFRITASDFSFDNTGELSATVNPLSSTPQSVNTYYESDDSSTHAVGAIKGKLESSTDSAGLTTFYSYTKDGNVARTWRRWQNPDSLGSDRWVVDTNIYDGARRLTSTKETVYTASGDALSIDPDPAHVDGDGYPGIEDAVFDNRSLVVTQTSYNSVGKTDTTTDQYGGETQSHYDERGNLVETVNPDGAITRSVFDAMGRVILATDRFKPGQSDPIQATRTIYDSLGRISETQRVSGVSITVDAVGTGDHQYYRVSAVTGAGIDLTLDSQGISHSIGAIDPAFTGFLSHSQSIYDADGRVSETITSTSTETVELHTGSIYYQNGQVNYSGEISTLTAEELDEGEHHVRNLPFDTSRGLYLINYTTYTYDRIDGSLPSGAVSYDSVTDANGYVTKTYKDILGRTIETLYDDGSFTQTIYGVGGAAVTGYGVSGMSGFGQEVVQIAQRKDTPTDPIVATLNFYDAAGRLTDVFLPAVTDPENPTTMKRPQWHYDYDENGNEISQTDPNLHTTTFEYDEMNRRTSRTLPGDGNSATNDSETWTYDGFGRVATHVDFKEQSTKYVYDDDPSLPTEEQTNLGRLVEEQRFTGAFDSTPDETTHYHYDELGRQVEVDEYGFSTREPVRGTVYGYDPITGQVASVEQYEASGDIGTINYAYDPATGEHTRTYTNHDDTVYQYDEFGRLANVEALVFNDTRFATLNSDGSITGSPKTTTYTYDADGNLETTTLPPGIETTLSGGMKTTYTYDDLNRMYLEEIKDGNGNLISSYHYYFRDDGLKDHVIESRINDDGSTFSDTRIDWTYDDDGHLLTETSDGGNDSIQNGSDYTDTYTYDLAGNRLTKSHDEVDTNNKDETITYDYNDDDQLLSEDSTDNSHDATYGYDANGSTTLKSTSAGDTTYRYDLRNRLVGVDTNGDRNDEQVYEYDSAGNRIISGQDSDSDGILDTHTYYLVDTNNPTGYSQVLEEFADVGASVTSNAYLIGLDVIGQTDSAGELHELFLYDGHGSVRRITDGDGNITAGTVYDYDAFGNAIDFDASTSATKVLYTGELFDSNLGQYDLRARNYDQSIGRFTGRDETIFDPSDFVDANLYSYVGGNPIVAIDPSGHESLIGVTVVIGTIAVLTAMLVPGCGKSSSSSAGSVGHGYSVSSPSAITAGVGTFNIKSASFGGLQGYQVTYSGYAAPPGTKIILVQAIESKGGANQTKPVIDYAPEHRNDIRDELLTHKSFLPPAYETGITWPQISPDEKQVHDTPSGTDYANISIMAIQRSLSGKATDKYLGAINFEFDSIDGNIFLPSKTISAAGDGPYNPVGATNGGYVWQKAIDKWNAAAGQGKTYPYNEQ